MKNHQIWFFILFVLSFNVVSAQSDIEFVSPSWGTTLTGNSHADYVPVTISYNSVTCTTEVCRGIDHISLLVKNTTTNTTTTYTYYEEGEHSVTLNLEAGEYECTIVQYEEYYFNGSTLVSESDRDNLEFKVKYKIQIKTNVGGVIKYAETVSFLQKSSGYTTPGLLIGKNIGMEAPDQEIYGSYYIWKTSGDISKWKQKKLNSNELDVSTNQRFYYTIANDDNMAVFTGYLRYDDEAPATPQNLSVAPLGDQPFSHPLVTWSANGESDLAGYKVYRKKDSESWHHIETVTTNSYTDDDILAPIQYSKYTYRVSAIDINNNISDYSNEDFIYGYKINKTNAAEEEKIDELPDEFLLSQNYPNPFNPTTSISYSIPKDEHVSIRVFNALGKEVVNLVNGFKRQGQYSVLFDGSNLSSGIYYYEIRTNSYHSVKKMILTK